MSVIANFNTYPAPAQFAGGPLHAAKQQPRDRRHPEDGHQPPGRARQHLQPVGGEQAQRPVHRFVHPVGVAGAQAADLRYHGGGPVDQVLRNVRSFMMHNLVYMKRIEYNYQRFVAWRDVWSPTSAIERYGIHFEILYKKRHPYENVCNDPTKMQY